MINPLLKDIGYNSHRLFKVLSSEGVRSLLLRMANSEIPKEITIPIPSGHIAGKIWNEGGFPILGLHGWMDNAGTWDCVAPLLPKNFSLISIDFLGHGFSSANPIGASSHFMDLVLVMERVVQHFGWKEVNLLGHSMGGCSAMLYAATFPEKVRKVIMIDVIKPLSYDAADQPERSAKGIQELMAAETIIGRNRNCYEYCDILNKMVKSYGSSLTEEAAKILLKRGSVKHTNGLYSFNYDPRLKTKNIIGMTLEQQKAFANRLQCELLIIKALSGPMYEGRELYDEILGIYKKKPKCFYYKEVEGTHHVHLNCPEIVAPIICEFIRDDGDHKIAG
ncbi:probable serine hydrolase isoform X2 [Panulirus ornatus]|uniref:probable serine hydrolase isoform X2 n=1 Tax=Panulirus ornatus TaxID=150431 RepID=UPI003A86AECC